MRITVLGKSPSWQDAGGACSGYLVQECGTTVLLDCGNGVFAKLRERVDYADVDAVVISHLHADHFLDLVPFSYALTHSPRRAGGADGRRPALWAPAGARDTFRRVVGAWGDGTLVEAAFGLREYAVGDEVAAGPLRVTFAAVPHYVPTCAIAVTAGNGAGRFVFGADHGPNPALTAFARDAALLLVEATLTEPEPGDARGHMTPAEAGALGREAGAARLVLTHISDEVDASWAAAEASRAFGGAVEVACEGAVYEV